MFTQLRGEGAFTLTLAGPGEFLPDRPIAPPPAQAKPTVLAPLALKAYTLLNYNCMYLSPASAAWFAAHAKTQPPRSVPMADLPVTRTFPADDKIIGLVLFPPGAGPEGAPTAAQADAALLAARTLQRKADFIIAVSPWGMYAESALLPRLDGLVHLLLGGGGGVGFPGQGSPLRPGLLWARPDMKGRAVTVIDILSWPVNGASFQWTEGVTYAARELLLNNTVLPDPAMSKLLAPVPVDAE